MTLLNSPRKRILPYLFFVLVYDMLLIELNLNVVRINIDTVIGPIPLL